MLHTLQREALGFDTLPGVLRLSLLLPVCLSLALPLINFGTEDRVEPLADAPALPFSCAHIEGRTRDVRPLRLLRGRDEEIHSELIEDCLDLVPQVRSYFIHQECETVDIAVQADSEHNLDAVRGEFLSEHTRHFADLDQPVTTFSRLGTSPRPSPASA